MGSTKAWWLAALDPRVKLCIDLCCLTDYEELIKIDNLKGHGIYYYRAQPAQALSSPRHQRADRAAPALEPERTPGSADSRPPASSAFATTCRLFIASMARAATVASSCSIAVTKKRPRCGKLVLAWLDEHL